MAGYKCPDCGRKTLYQEGTKYYCNNPECGFKATTPPLGGKGGKGQYCVNCKRYTVFKDLCSNCGTRYKHGKK